MTPSIWQLLIVLFILSIPFILGLLLIQKKEYLELSGHKRYAGFWHRFLAGIIDLIILYVVTFIVSLVLSNISYQLALIIYTGASGFISLLYYVLFQSSLK